MPAAERGGNHVNDTAPTLYPSATELWQYAQAITTLSTLAGRIRARIARAREHAGRLALADGENAARHHEARRHPPVRMMTDEERSAWQARVPAPVASPGPGEPVTVWTAQLLDAAGKPTTEWGLEAHVWDGGRTASSLFMVCRDAEDALAMAHHLRGHGTREHLDRLHALAASAPGQFVKAPEPTVSARLGSTAPALALSEAAWESALRQHLPAALADQIIVNDPAHPHHAAWCELHKLADGEVQRVGADPAKLARLVGTVPRWRDDVRNPPALAHWTLTNARSSPGYPAKVQPDTTSARQPPPNCGGPTSTPAAVPRLAEVRSPDQATVWVRGLDPANPEHRLEAKLGFGHWGPDVDRALAAKFRGLVEKANLAAQRERDPNTATTQHSALVELAGEVDRLDPAKAVDRRAAHIMLGRVPPEVDLLLAEKFGGDPLFAEKLRTLYPDGLPEAGEGAARPQPRQAADTAAATHTRTAVRPTAPTAAAPRRRA